jgi:hypothetical protein
MPRFIIFQQFSIVVSDVSAASPGSVVFHRSALSSKNKSIIRITVMASGSCASRTNQCTLRPQPWVDEPKRYGWGHRALGRRINESFPAVTATNHSSDRTFGT